jgi:hypothetical protein
MLDNKVMSMVLCLILSSMIIVGGCSSYTVPGKAAKMSLFEEKVAASPSDQPKTEHRGDIQIVERKPTANFPASIVVVRVQEPGYKSQTADSFGGGNFSVVTVRDIEKEEDFARLEKLGGLTQISPMSRLLLPSHFQSDRELRTVAARLQADMVLIYTIDTTFLNTDTSTPLGIISLGFGPTIRLRVITTVSAILMDTQTGFIYATAEETAREETTTSAISNKNACDEIRLRTERKAFEQFLNRFGTLWTNIVVQYKK